MGRKKQKKEFISTWAFEAFAGERTFLTKPMFGCLAAYVQGRMVMVLTEDPGDRSYRGKTYPYDIWDGIMLPTDKDKHESLIREFGGLRPHPVLGKWLYLPASDENFETIAREIARRIAQGDPRLGIDLEIKIPKRGRRE